MNKTDHDFLDLIKPGDNIFLHSACAEPQTLLEMLMEGVREERPNLQDLSLWVLTYRGAGSPPPLYADPQLLARGRLRLKSLFPHSVLREASRAGLVDYVPTSFSNLPGLIRDGHIKIDLALLQLAPPDEQGRASLGPSADCIEAIMETTPLLVGEINRQLPQTLGLAVDTARFAALIESNRALLEVPSQPTSPLEQRIAANVVELIPDGATVQLGVGAVPEAVAELLATARHDLSLHSAAISDVTIKLLESEAVTNSHTALAKGQLPVSLLLGTRRLFDFAHQNPGIAMRPFDFMNNPRNVAALPRFVSVNSALECDFWGQVNAEMLGDWQLAGVGGQLDYVQGAWAGGGLSIIALPSHTGSGKPRIVPRLSAGTPVSTPRHLAAVIVTENGIADLRGKSLTERERLLKKLLG